MGPMRRGRPQPLTDRSNQNSSCINGFVRLVLVKQPAPWSSPGLQPSLKIRRGLEIVAGPVWPNIRPSLRNGFNGVLRALPGNRAFLLGGDYAQWQALELRWQAAVAHDGLVAGSSPAGSPAFSRFARQPLSSALQRAE